eukprot:scaffold143380_cov50-Attheya_sp.AAC.1
MDYLGDDYAAGGPSSSTEEDALMSTFHNSMETPLFLRRGKSSRSNHSSKTPSASNSSGSNLDSWHQSNASAESIASLTMERAGSRRQAQAQTGHGEEMPPLRENAGTDYPTYVNPTYSNPHSNPHSNPTYTSSTADVNGEARMQQGGKAQRRASLVHWADEDGASALEIHTPVTAAHTLAAKKKKKKKRRPVDVDVDVDPQSNPEPQPQAQPKPVIKLRPPPEDKLWKDCLERTSTGGGGAHTQGSSSSAMTYESNALYSVGTGSSSSFYPSASSQSVSYAHDEGSRSVPQRDNAYGTNITSTGFENVQPFEDIEGFTNDDEDVFGIGTTSMGATQEPHQDSFHSEDNSMGPPGTFLNAPTPAPPQGVLRAPTNRRVSNENTQRSVGRRTSFAADVHDTSSHSSPATSATAARRRTSIGMGSSMGTGMQGRNAERSRRASRGKSTVSGVGDDDWDDHSALRSVSSSNYVKRSSMMTGRQNSNISLISDDNNSGQNPVASHRNSSHTAIHMFDQAGHVMSETEKIDMLKKNGKCTTCGIVRTSRKVKYGPFKAFRRMEGLTIRSKVYKGYCLNCHEINDVKIFLGEGDTIETEDSNDVSDPSTLVNAEDDEASYEEEEMDDIYDQIVNGVTRTPKASAVDFQSSIGGTNMMMRMDSDPMMLNDDSFSTAGDRSVTFDASGNVDGLYGSDKAPTLDECMKSFKIRTGIVLFCVGLFAASIGIAIYWSTLSTDRVIGNTFFDVSLPPTSSPTLSPTYSSAPSESPTMQPTSLEWQSVGQDIMEPDVRSFGAKVALSGNGLRMVVSAPHDDTAGVRAGQVLTYGLNYTGQPYLGNWVRLGEPIYGDTEQDEAGRGMDISEDGSTLAVGFPGNGFGFVRLYKFNNENETWEPKGDPIFGPHMQSGFGLAISLSEDGDSILVGAPFYNSAEKLRSGQVSVYQFDMITNGWFLYGSPVDGKDSDFLFGTSVDFTSDGTWFVAGAPGDLSKRGTVQVYTLSRAVNGEHFWDTYAQEIKGEVGERFGHEVCIGKNEEIIAASSPLAASANGKKEVGKVATYTWEQVTTITKGIFFPLDDAPEGPRPESRFGNSIAMSASGVSFVAAEEVKSSFPNKNTGSVRAYYFNVDSLWELTGDFVGLPLGPVETYVNKGPSVALSGEETSKFMARYLAIGYESVEFEDSTIPSSGLVRVYEWRGIRL